MIPYFGKVSGIPNLALKTLHWVISFTMLWDEEDPDLSIPDMNPSCGDIPNIDAGCRQVCRWAALRLTGGEGVKSRQGEGVPLKDGQPLDLQIGPVRNHENKKCSLGRC